MLAARQGGTFEISFRTNNFLAITWLTIPSIHRGTNQCRTDIQIFILDQEIFRIQWTSVMRRSRPEPVPPYYRGEEEIPEEEEF